MENIKITVDIVNQDNDTIKMIMDHMQELEDKLNSKNKNLNIIYNMVRKKKTEEELKNEEEKIYFGSITLLVPDEMGVLKNLKGEIKLVDTLTKTKNPKKIKGEPSIILREDKDIKEPKLVSNGITVKEKKQGENLTETQKQGLQKIKETIKKVNQEKGKKKVKKYVEDLKEKVKTKKMNHPVHKKYDKWKKQFEILPKELIEDIKDKKNKQDRVEEYEYCLVMYETDIGLIKSYLQELQYKGNEELRKICSDYEDEINNEIIPKVRKELAKIKKEYIDGYLAGINKGDDLTETQKQGLKKIKETLKKVNQEKAKKQVERYATSIKDKEKYDTYNKEIEKTLESVRKDIKYKEDLYRKRIIEEYELETKKDYRWRLNKQKTQYDNMVREFEEDIPKRINEYGKHEIASMKNRKEADTLLELSKKTLDKLIAEQKVIIKKIKNETGRKSKII
jgi:hypothetical protein